MTSYIIRRLLLVIPTFFGTTLLVFWILNITPDGPYDRKIEEIKAMNMQQGSDGTSSGSVDDSPKGEVDRETSKKIKRKMPLWNPDKSIFIRYLMWLGLNPYETEWIDSHDLNTPYRYTINTIDQVNSQGVPISLQKYIFPILKDNEILVYESKEGTDFNAKGYNNLDEINFDVIGYIPKLRIWEPYIYTIRELDIIDNQSILLQKYIFMDEKMTVYESIECTNISYKNYTILPSESKLGEQSEDFWLESNWKASKIDDVHANLSLEDKGQLIAESLFSKHWVKSEWDGEKINSFNWFYQRINKKTNEMIFKWAPKKEEKSSDIETELSLLEFKGIFNGYLGETNDKKSVAVEIWNRIHISSFFGITGFLLSYLVCIPLGIMKALKHGSKFDVISSGVVFIGYSIPAYAFGVLLIWFFASSESPLISWGWIDETILPNKGWRPANWDSLSLWEQIIGQIKHALLPTICYVLGSFATLTVLMKNSLMENMSQDYVRTAFAKGLREKTVIFRHAVRNSLIPMATGIGGIIGLFLAGSYLIEKVFNIDGIGLLGFKSIQNRDYGIFLGFLVIGTVIRLMGNLISDICYAIIDPRIRFK